MVNTELISGHKQKYRLSYRLLLYILICSSFFTMVITVFQLYFDYQKDLRKINANIQFIEKRYLKAIAASLYNIDLSQLKILLQGAVSIQDIEYIQVDDPSDSDNLKIFAGNPDAPKDIVRHFPLKITNEFNQLVHFGTMTIVVSLDGVYSRLLERTLVIMLSNATKTFPASICIILIIQWLITRHLHTMADYANNLNLDKLDKPLRIKRRKQNFIKNDELDIVVNAINKMRIRLNEEIIEHKRTSEIIVQNEKMKSLGEMATGIAHEINNPNNYILLNSTILKESWHNIIPILERYLTETGDFNVNGVPYSDFRNHIPTLFTGIVEGGERIKKIVRGMKDYSYPEINTERTKVSIKSVLDSALTLLANQIKKSTHNLTVEHKDDLPLVWGNYQRLEQILINLIQNACEALTGINQHITISTRYDLDHNNIIICVTDEGVGIPQEHLQRIKEPFFTTKRSSGGSGLGLFISSGIIEEHQGQLEFNSSNQKGTMVKMTLPINKDENSSFPTKI